jgi:hypothetical protein
MADFEKRGELELKPITTLEEGNEAINAINTALANRVLSTEAHRAIFNGISKQLAILNKLSEDAKKKTTTQNISGCVTRAMGEKTCIYAKASPANARQSLNTVQHTASMASYDVDTLREDLQALKDGAISIDNFIDQYGDSGVLQCEE